MDDLDFGNTIKGFTPGQKILNRYKLDRILGRGGMGVVWLARDEELERDIALKFLPEIVALDPEAVADLKRETRRNLDLTHPHIVRIHDFVSDKRTAAIAMEYVDGSTLAALKLERPGRVFTVAELRPWVEQWLEALHYAHAKAKVVHRDLKPANLMITDGGDLKITDFGIATSITDSVSRVSKQAGSSGTPVYMSPQQMMGEKAAVTDDLYAVGATLYELLTSKPPFYSGNVLLQAQNKTPPSIAERRDELGIAAEPVSPEWEQAIAACLAKDPADRPQSAGELAERLGLGPKGNTQRPTPTVERPKTVGASLADAQKVQRVVPNALSAGQSNALGSTRSTSKTPFYAALAAGALLLGGLGWYFGIHVPEQKHLAEIAQQKAWERAAEEVASKAGEVMGTPDKNDNPPAAAKKAVAEYAGAAARGSRLVGGIVRVFGEVAAVTSISVNSQRGVIAFRASGESAEIVSQRMNRVVDKLDADLVVGDGSKSALVALDYVDAAGYHNGLVEVNFTSAPGQPAASAFADEAPARYPKVTLDIEVLALADGDAARAGGVPVHDLVKANELAVNHQRFYKLEKETGVKLLDLGQLVPEGLGIPFRVSLEGSLTSALRFMQALEAGPWRIRYKEYSIAVTAPQVAKANPSTVKVVQPQAGQPWENSLGQKFVPVPGTDVLFCIWETREQDYSAFASATGRIWSNANAGSTHPAVKVSWEDAKAFCAWLTEKERKEGRIGPDQGYRLPTDAEWSEAVGLKEEPGTPQDKWTSANNNNVYPWGTIWPPPHGSGNYAPSVKVDSFERTSPVGSFSANRHGLHDLGGNVWEWCEDWFNNKQMDRVLRGASFYESGPGVLGSKHRYLTPAPRLGDIGFRVVLADGSAAPAGLRTGASSVSTLQPSEEFKTWIANNKFDLVTIRPSSVYILNKDGTTYKEGEIVNPGLSIVFVGYDEETKLLKFKDASGAVVTRAPR